MLEVFGELYYIDLESVSRTIEIEPLYEVSGNTEQSINLVSFEVIKMMLEIIMTEREEVDENLGTYSTKNLSIPFRVAFNTLLKHQILKHL
jgi:transcription termination factor NusB